MKVRINPDILKWSRKSAFFDIEEVAKKLKVKRGVVLSWEEGSGKPTLTQARRLSSLYKRTLATLYLPTPPQEDYFPADYRTLELRNVKKSHELAFAIRRAEKVQEAAAENKLIKKYSGDFGRLTVGQETYKVCQSVRSKIFTSTLGQSRLGDHAEAYKKIRDRLHKLGILVLQTSLNQEEARGFSLVRDSLPPTIVVNSKDPVSARIFTIFHELCHIILRDGGLCDLNNDRKVEVYCNKFAANVLVPTGDLIEHKVLKDHHAGTKVYQDREIEKLANYFKVSREVILRRLLDLGLTSKSFYEDRRGAWNKEYKLLKKKREERGIVVQYSNKILSQFGATLVSRLFSRYDQGEITFSDVGEFLGVKARHLDEIEIKSRNTLSRF